jgi:hypothetical protein
MNHYLQLIKDEIFSIQGQKDYCLQVLNAGGLESWESKEYSDLVEHYDQKLKELNERLPAAGRSPAVHLSPPTSPRNIMNNAIEAQAQKVRAAYAATGSLNPDFEREFDILSDMRRAEMAQEFRAERGLPSTAATPYD